MAATTVVALVATTLVAAPSPAYAATSTAAAPAADVTATDAATDTVNFRISLPTVADRDGWRRDGFRVEIGLRYLWLAGLSSAPSGDGFGVFARFGTRLDADWSLLVGLSYGSVAGDAGVGLLGLRYAVTAEPVFHVGDHLSVAIGLGLAGFVEGGTGRPEVNASQRDALVAGLTLPSTGPPVPSCNGAGITGLVRVGWSIVLGPMSATSFDLQVDGQSSLCVDDTGRVEPDTASAIVRRQWWRHVGWSLGWSVGWR